MAFLLAFALLVLLDVWPNCWFHPASILKFLLNLYKFYFSAENAAKNHFASHWGSNFAAASASCKWSFSLWGQTVAPSSLHLFRRTWSANVPTNWQLFFLANPCTVKHWSLGAAIQNHCCTPSPPLHLNFFILLLQALWKFDGQQFRPASIWGLSPLRYVKVPC